MDDFEIKKTKDRGQGLFAKRSYEKGAVILHFGGTHITRQEIIDQKISNDVSDRFLQIGKDLFLVVQDFSQFVNHHCVPNCFVKIAISNAFLVAAHPISKGDELFFDYSLSSNDSNDAWEMGCCCGAYTCRKKISGIQSLSDAQLALAIKKGIVPKYNLPK